MRRVFALVASVLVLLAAAARVGSAQVTDVYRDSKMDFGSIQTVAVVPFSNLARDQVVAERVRDVFVSRLLSTEAVYVLPVGEVARGIATLEIASPSTPTPEQVVKLGAMLKVDAVITGVVREYGEVRSGSSAAGAISISVQLLEGQTGKTVWTASSTKGGIDIWDRLFGGGGKPMNDVTRDAVNDVIQKLFK